MAIGLSIIQNNLENILEKRIEEQIPKIVETDSLLSNKKLTGPTYAAAVLLLLLLRYARSNLECTKSKKLSKLDQPIVHE